MANVLMPVMVVPDCGLKRQSLAQFVDKQEKHRGGRQRAIAFAALPTRAYRKSSYSAIASPEPPNSAGKSLSLGRPSRIGSTVSA
jgi:hypothetical protein